MKTRPGKHHDQATDIILNDKEMEVLINSLVQKAHGSGACVTHLNRAISTIWQEQFHVEFKPKELNRKENAFAKKVKNFLAYYENDLIMHTRKFYNRHYSSFNKDSFYQLLCSIYGTFENEDNVTKELIVSYAKEHGFKNPYYCNFMGDIRFLYDFISEHLYFEHPADIPVYSEKYVGAKHSIVSVTEYNNFSKQFVLRNTKTCKTAVSIIWLIERFF